MDNLSANCNGGFLRPASREPCKLNRCWDDLPRNCSRHPTACSAAVLQVHSFQNDTDLDANVETGI